MRPISALRQGHCRSSGRPRSDASGRHATQALLPSSGQPRRSFRQAVKNYMGVISQLGRAYEAPNATVSEAPTCYVELTSFKLIRFSAFWAKCLRVAWRYRRHSIDCGIAHPPRARQWGRKVS
jgi:hypothetical protein